MASVCQHLPCLLDLACFIVGEAKNLNYPQGTPKLLALELAQLLGDLTLHQDSSSLLGKIHSTRLLCLVEDLPAMKWNYLVSLRDALANKLAAPGASACVGDQPARQGDNSGVGFPADQQSQTTTFPPLAIVRGTLAKRHQALTYHEEQHAPAPSSFSFREGEELKEQATHHSSGPRGKRQHFNGTPSAPTCASTCCVPAAGRDVAPEVVAYQFAAVKTQDPMFAQQVASAVAQYLTQRKASLEQSKLVFNRPLVVLNASNNDRPNDTLIDIKAVDGNCPLVVVRSTNFKPREWGVVVEPRGVICHVVEKLECNTQGELNTTLDNRALVATVGGAVDKILASA